MSDVVVTFSNPPHQDQVARGHPWLAWLFILLAVVAVAWLRQEGPQAIDEPTERRIAYLMVEQQAKYLVGLKQLMPPPQHGQLAAEVSDLNTGPLWQRLRYVVLAGELAGHEKALQELDSLEKKIHAGNVEPSAQETRTLDILRRLYADYGADRLGAPSLEPAERKLLLDELGWFGKLALAPPGGPDQAARQAVVSSAQKTMAAILAGTLLAAIVGLAGLVALIAVASLLLTGTLRQAVGNFSGAGGIYAETFAIWLLLFMVLSLVASFTPEGSRLWAAGLAMLLSLFALAWPTLRGVGWQQVRSDVGLSAGRQPLIEPLLGVGCYAMALPLMAVGILLTVLLMQLQAGFLGGNGPDDFSPQGLPAHPVVETVLSGGWWGRLQVLLLASVVAPLVEETMFRGVLYRHLREATGRLGFALSFLASATVVSFVFALVHPQGVVAVPALMSLAYAFALIREWRGTLVPAMVAHGINNGLMMTLLILSAES